MSSDSGFTAFSSQADWQSDMRDLSKALDDYSLATLRAMARAIGLKPRSTHKEGIVSSLAERLTHPNHIREALAALHPSERDLLDILDLSDGGGQGKLTLDVLSALQRLNDGLSPDGPPPDISALEGMLESLASRGLVLRKPGGKDQQRWRLPDAVHRNLPQLSRKLSPSRVRKVRELRVEPSRGTDSCGAAYVLWRHIQLRKASKPLPTRRRPAEYSDESLVGWETPAEEIDLLLSERRRGWLSASSLPLTILPPPMSLSEGSLRETSLETGFPDSALDLLTLLLAELGLVSVQGRQWIAREDGILPFLRSTPAQRIRLLVKAWQATESWSVVPRHMGNSLILRRRAGQTHLKQDGLTRQLSRARRVPLRLLSRFQVGSWYGFDSFLEMLRGLAPNFLLPAQVNGISNGADWWGEEGESGRLLDPADEGSWHLIHRAYLSALWKGPLCWMGLVDLAYDHDRLAAFRLTELGGYALGHRPEPPVDEPEHATLTVGKDLTITVRADQPDSEVHNLLGRAAQFVDAGSRGFRYRITQDTACRAFQKGLTLEAMTKVLRERSRNGLPPSALRTLENWWRCNGAIRAYQNLTLISFADDAALDEMMAVTSLKEHLVRVFGPRLAAIEPESLDTLRSELVKRGYTPMVE